GTGIMASIYDVKETEARREALTRAYREPDDRRLTRISGGPPAEPERNTPESRPSQKGLAALFRNISIGKRLALGFGVLLGLLLCVAGAGYYSTQKVSDEMMDMLGTDIALEDLYSNSLLDAQDLRKDERDAFLGHGDARMEQIGRDEWNVKDKKVRESLEN